MGEWVGGEGGCLSGKLPGPILQKQMLRAPQGLPGARGNRRGQADMAGLRLSCLSTEMLWTGL